VARVRKIPFGTAVRFCWHDSKSHMGWQYNPERPRQTAKIQTLGYVVQANDEGITITSSIGTHRETIDDITVPWGAIEGGIEELGDTWNR